MPISYREEQFKKTQEEFASFKKRETKAKIMQSIKEASGTASLFMELAIQASELSSAAMKMAAHYAECRSKFPDEKESYTARELLFNVVEEYSDVQLVSKCIGLQEHKRLWDTKLIEWSKSEGEANGSKKKRHQ